MEESKDIVGTLFNSINYYDKEDLNKFINDMGNDHALYCLIQASNYGFKKGIYSLEEVEVVSKAIRILTNPEKKDDITASPPEPEVKQA